MLNDLGRGGIYGEEAFFGGEPCSHSKGPATDDTGSPWHGRTGAHEASEEHQSKLRRLFGLRSHWTIYDDDDFYF